MLGEITHELRDHIPLTLFGALTGIVVALGFVYLPIPTKTSQVLFSVFHPAHVFLSALATTAMFRLHSRRGVLATLLVGYVGAVGIGTLSDSLIPYLSELLLGIGDEHVNAELHLGFIHEWYLVNPLAILGILAAVRWPRTRVSHAGHVLLSTWASMSHLLMAMEHGAPIGVATWVCIPIVLFVAVWAPCCTSDIVFPLLFAGRKDRPTQSAKKESAKEG